MALGDLWALLVETLRTQRLRSFLTMLGIVIGIASVVLLSSIGEGAREGIIAEFTQFGTTIIGVQPGKQTTFGVGPGAFGGTTHPLKLEDGLALRHIPGVRYVAPHTMGMGEIEAGERSRHTYIYGTVWEERHILQWHPRIGTFLPPGDPDQAPPVCVLGATVLRELFPDRNPLGSHVRVGESRFTVVGVMSPKGQMLGFDMDDMVIIPVRRAMRMFNRDEVQEIHVLAANPGLIDGVTAAVRKALIERHDGEEDFTITSQADMLAVVNEVMDVVTAGVLVIAAVSVLVGSMGILTILWVSVHERTREIGLMKAVGASDRQVMLIFLAEAGALSLLGGAVGVASALAIGWFLGAAIPGFWIQTPPWIIPISLGASLGVGVLAGVIPAVRAAGLDPIEALRAE